jgi:hypothetical protein
MAATPKQRVVWKKADIPYRSIGRVRMMNRFPKLLDLGFDFRQTSTGGILGIHT